MVKLTFVGVTTDDIVTVPAPPDMLSTMKLLVSRITPTGIMSSTSMVVASNIVERFLIVTVYITSSPVLTKSGEELFWISRSSCGISNSPESESLPGLVSIMLEEVIVAVFCTVPPNPSLTVVVIWSVVEPPTGMEPGTFHIPVTEEYVPAESSETKLTAADSISSTTIREAADGPT